MCTRACSNYYFSLDVISIAFPSCEIVSGVRFVIDFCFYCVSWVLECWHASAFECLCLWTDHSAVAARRDSRFHHEGTKEWQNIHYAAHHYNTRPDQSGLQSLQKRSRRMLEDNDDLSTAKVHCLVSNKFWVQISAPPICRFLRLKLNWITVRARTGPMISDMNKIKRVEFAKRCIAAQAITTAPTVISSASARMCFTFT